jgi:hypothetical protein
MRAGVDTRLKKGTDRGSRKVTESGSYPEQVECASPNSCFGNLDVGRVERLMTLGEPQMTRK